MPIHVGCGASSVARRLALSLAVLAAGTARAQSADEAQLTVEELARLAHGELVARPVAEQRGKLDLVGGTSWQLIDAKPEIVWQALLDTSHYRKMLPRVLEARVVESAGAVRTVFLRQGAAFFRTSYYLKVRHDAARHEIIFALDDTRPHRIEAAWGFYSVHAYRGGRTLLVYGIMADMGQGIVTLIMRGIVHDWMLRVPWMVKRFVEGSGKWIYR